MWPPERFQARLTPQEWDALTDSWMLDPPIEDALRALSGLVAQLIADQRNIHRGKDATPANAADFLPTEPKEDEAEIGDAEGGPEMPPAEILAGVPGARAGGNLLMGHGAKPPQAALDAFFGGGAPTDTE